MGDKKEKEYVIDRIKIDGRNYIIKLNDHSLYRINKNNIEISDVDKLVKRAIPFAPLDSVSAKDRFEVIDAETCLFVAFGIFRGDRVSSVFIKTSYIWDGKSPLSRICLILNKSTASDEFLEAQDIANAYGHTYTNGGNASYEPEKSFIPKNFDLSYKKDGKTNLNFGEPTSLKGWEKYHDPERPEIKKYVDDLVTKRNKGKKPPICFSFQSLLIKMVN